MNTLQETGQPGNKKKKKQSHGNPDRHRAGANPPQSLATGILTHGQTSQPPRSAHTHTHTHTHCTHAHTHTHTHTDTHSHTYTHTHTHTHTHPRRHKLIRRTSTRASTRACSTKYPYVLVITVVNVPARGIPSRVPVKPPVQIPQTNPPSEKTGARRISYSGRVIPTSLGVYD